MQHTFDIIQVVSFLAAFIALASRLFVASRPFWSRFPAWAQTLLPVLVPTLTAAAQGLTGVKSWSDLSVLFVVSAGMLLPGLPSNRSSAPLQAGKDPKLSPSAGDVAVAESMIAKASVRPMPLGETETTPLRTVTPGPLLLLLVVGLAFHSQACIRGVTPKTIDQAALILCDTFFSAQRPALSFEDVEKAFCSTAEQIAPFLSSAKVAVERGGAVRMHRSEQP
jgi:hypothetical protein